MRSWFQHSRRKLPPNELASGLLQAFVLDIRESEKAETYGLPTKVHAAFYEQSKLYKEALIWFTLDAQSKLELEYAAVLLEFQTLVLPNQATPTQAGLARAKQLSAATDDLLRLLNRDLDTFSWSSEWFGAIGAELINPAALSMFAMYWLQTYLMLGEFVRERVRLG